MKLSRRIHLYSTVVFALLLIIMNVSVYSLFSRVLIEDETELAEADTIATAERIRQSIGEIAEKDLLRAYVPLHGMLNIVDGQGKSIALVTSATEIGLSSQIEKAVFRSQLTTEYRVYEGNSYVFSSVPIIWSNGDVVNVQMMESIQSTINNLHVLRNVLIIVTLAALIPALLSGGLLARVIMRPISAMTTTMRSIRESGQFKKVELKVHTKDELTVMGETFNHMMEQLERNYERQKRFVSDASHELRTPLTVIESYSSLLLRRMKERPELLEESIAAIHSEAVRMKMMAEQLLQLANRKEDWQVERSPVELNALLASTADAFQQAYGREVAVQTETTDQPFVTVTDEMKLKQLLYIFLDNARKYSEEKILLRLERQSEVYRISISDRGVGIPKEDLPYVFDRFYRVEEARTREAGGAGLGLSLAKELADAIGVSINIDSLEGIGTTVRILLAAEDQVD